MILVDTGPFAALFDPKDGRHAGCRDVLRSLREPLYTTVPVLTEAFHLLTPDSQGARRLRDFVLRGGVSVWFFQPESVERAFGLMEQYRDRPMDLADASLVVATEALDTRRIFTLDRNDFECYRILRGRHYQSFEIVG